MSHRSRDSHKLSAAQIRVVLDWEKRRRRFLKRYGTIARLALRLGVSARAIYRCIDSFKASGGRSLSSRFGRPSSLDASTQQKVFTWSNVQLRFFRINGNVEGLAVRLRVSKGVIYGCIRRGGHYRRPFGQQIRKSDTSGQLPSGSIDPRSRRPNRKTVEGDNRRRSLLLRRWRGVDEAQSHEPTRPSRGAKRGRRGHRQTP